MVFHHGHRRQLRELPYPLWKGDRENQILAEHEVAYHLPHGFHFVLLFLCLIGPNSGYALLSDVEETFLEALLNMQEASTTSQSGGWL